MFNTLAGKTVLGMACGAMLFACDQGPNTGRGFKLPEGDIASGQQSFADLGCHQCHGISGVDFPHYDHAPPTLFELGGEVVRVKSYGELVTSIVNPQHIIDDQYLASFPAANRGEVQSPMPSFNAGMTVDQLIDIVAFLDSHYEKLNPEYIGYYSF